MSPGMNKKNYKELRHVAWISTYKTKKKKKPEL